MSVCVCVFVPFPENHSMEGIGPFASEALVYQDEDTLTCLK